MSSSDRVNKIADLLLSHSLGEDDRVDEAKVAKILDDLRQNPLPQHIEILKRFAFLVRRHVSTYQGTLQFMGGDGVEIANRLCKKEFIKSKTAEIKSDELFFTKAIGNFYTDPTQTDRIRRRPRHS